MSVSAPLGSLVLQFSTRGKGTGDWTQEQAGLLGAFLATLSISRKTLTVSCFLSSFSFPDLTLLQSMNDNLAIHFKHAPHTKPAPKGSFQTNKIKRLAWVQTRGYRHFSSSSLCLHVCKQTIYQVSSYSFELGPSLQNCPSEPEVMSFSPKHR